MKYPKVTRRETTQTDFDGTVYTVRENCLAIQFSGKQVAGGPALARLDPVEAVRLCEAIQRELDPEQYRCAAEALKIEREPRAVDLEPGDVIMYPLKSGILDPANRPCLVTSVQRSEERTAELMLIDLIALEDLTPPLKARVRPYTVAAKPQQAFRRAEEE